MKKILLAIVALAVVVGGVALAQPHAALAASSAQGEICQGVGGVSGGSGCTSGTQSLNNLASTIINVFSAVVGVVAVIMLMVGGFKYVTSAGDSNKISSAKNTIVYAIVGLIIVALAQVIVQFVLSKVA